jgi:hypothetical protein
MSLVPALAKLNGMVVVTCARLRIGRNYDSCFVIMEDRFWPYHNVSVNLRRATIEEIFSLF